MLPSSRRLRRDLQKPRRRSVGRVWTQAKAEGPVFYAHEMRERLFDHLFGRDLRTHVNQLGEPAGAERWWRHSVEQRGDRLDVGDRGCSRAKCFRKTLSDGFEIIVLRKFAPEPIDLPD